MTIFLFESSTGTCGTKVIATDVNMNLKSDAYGCRKLTFRSLSTINNGDREDLFRFCESSEPVHGMRSGNPTETQTAPQPALGGSRIAKLLAKWLAALDDVRNWLQLGLAARERT
jgi:hypothetical protein